MKIPNQFKNCKFRLTTGKVPISKMDKDITFNEMKKLNHDYGIVLGKLVAVDFDYKNIGEHFISEFPKTLVDSTPHGIHILLKVTGDIKSTSLKFGNIDIGEIRTGNQIIVGPGSKEYNKGYTVLKDNPIATINAKKLLHILDRYVTRDSKHCLRGCFTKVINSKGDIDLTGNDGHLFRVAIANECMHHGFENFEIIAMFERQTDFDFNITKKAVEYERNRGDKHTWSCKKLQEDCSSIVTPFCEKCSVKKGIILGNTLDARDTTFIDWVKNHADIYWEETPFGKRLRACELANLITYGDQNSETLVGKNRGFLVLNTKDRQILYYKDGVYNFLGENRIGEIVHSVLGGMFSINRAREVISCVQNDEQLKIEIDDLSVNSRYICFNNGVYDIEISKLLPHSPEFYFTNKIAHNFDKNAKCPTIAKFFSDIVKKDSRLALEEIVGWCFQRDYKIQYLIFLLGDGANGKGTLLKLLHALLGNKNTTAMTLHELVEDKFCKGRLFQKVANLGDDIGCNSITATDNIKRLTGDGKLFGQEKGKNGFDFYNYAKMIFNCNNLPVFQRDNSFGLWRRFLVIEFPNKFYLKTDDKDLIDKMTTEQEMSGLINLGLKGLKRLHKNKIFTGAKSVEEQKQEYKDLSEPTRKYLETVYKYTAKMSDIIDRQTIWMDYNNDIRKTGKTALKMKDFWGVFWETFSSVQTGKLGDWRKGTEKRVLKCIKKR